MKTYNLLCLSEAVSPITHMRGVSGNESLVMREPVVSPHGVAWLPCLSANAIRHRFVREPGARWLIDEYGLRGALTLPQLNFLLHGGNLTEGGGRENTRRIADLYRCFPLLRLLGGTIPDQILCGSLDVWRGRLVCEENRDGLRADLAKVGWELPDPPLCAAEHFVSGYQYTRGDAALTAPDLAPEADSELKRGENRDGKSNLMIFAGQAVSTGAHFVHGFTVRHVSRVELGALLHALSLWQRGGGTIGGQAARGHGRLRTWLYLEGEDGSALVGEYLEYAAKVRAEAVNWLNDAFGAKGKAKDADEPVAVADVAEKPRRRKGATA